MSKIHSDSVIKRFWGYVEKTDTCWLWIGSKLFYGYGQMSIKNKPKRSNRLSWEIHYGEIPEGMNVCHKCDNTSCVNPNHLFLGTHQDNMRDMVSKNRQKICKGEKNKSHKLSDKDVFEIKRDFVKLSNKDARIYENKFNSKNLALKYGISQSRLIEIVNDKAWVHLEFDEKCKNEFVFVRKKIVGRKLNDEKVLEIRSKYPEKNTSVLAKEYQVSQPIIINIIKRKTWTHLSDINFSIEKYNENRRNNRRKKLNSKQVLEIRSKYPEKSLSELALEYKVSSSMISAIINRKTWYHI